MLTEKVQAALCDQINTEFASSYSYLAMSAYCDWKKFPGCARWLRIQSQEENGHALKLLDYLLARDCPVVFKEIATPRYQFSSIPEVFEAALAQELDVSESINRLYELAHTEKAFSTLVELQWFLTEQVEEEKTARQIVAKFALVKDDPSALLDLDRELGTRQSGDEGAVMVTPE
jgi:ferritin